MKPYSFEGPKDNPFLPDSDKTDEAVEAPQKTEAKKEKTKKDTSDKPQNDQHATKEEKKPKKPPLKPEKVTKDKEALEAKKQKRQLLVERSLHYKKLYEEVPIPRNPWVIARLMVAQHILAIQGQIEQPPVDATPTDELRLLASLDYMGTIADTLENPDIETSPEIKETCETLLHLAEETLHEGDENITHALIESGNDSARTLDIDTQIPDEFEQPSLSSEVSPSSLPTSGAALIAVLHHIRQKAHHQPIVPNPLNSSISSPSLEDTTETYSAQPSLQAQPIASPARTAHEGASLAVPERMSSERQADPLASLAVAATFVAGTRANTHPVQKNKLSSRLSSEQHNEIPMPPPTIPSHSYETRHVNNSARTNYLTDHRSSVITRHTPSPETVRSPDRQHHDDSSLSSSKIEHLPLVSLLAMAETVSIGHGQRLRSAYEKGAIDKDGLVKVLKSHAKHHDFLQEYKQQIVKRRNLVESSPEFLSSSHPQSDTPTDSTSADTAQEQFTPTIDPSPTHTEAGGDFTPTADLPQPLKHFDHKDPFITPEEKIFHPTWLVPVLLGALVLVVGVLIAFLILQ